MQSEEHGEAEEEQEQEQEQEQRGTAPHYPITISDMSAPWLGGGIKKDGTLGHPIR